MARSENQARGNNWIAVGWAFYLACSWTWCIGMFLPVLLLRDYGLWGFVVFAVPNVVGAAAMGWVLVSSGQAERILRKHRFACALFGAVTVAFHLYFLQWMGAFIPGLWWLGAIVAAPPAAYIALRLGQAGLRRTAMLVFAISAAALVSVVRDRSGAGGAPPATTPSLDLLWVAPVCVFGFALCPYLDPTFLRVRRECDARQSRLAFTLGFGLLFALMILLTVLYAPVFAGAPGAPLGAGFAGAATVGLIAAHLACQSLLTTSLHWKEGLPLNGPLLLVVPLVGLVAGLPAFHGWEAAGMPSREIVYRLFLAFYGLVFPAYVWLCMIPTADGHAGLSGPRGEWKLRVWCGAVGIAAPFYWMGLIAREELFLMPGLGAVLLARLAVRSRRRAG